MRQPSVELRARCACKASLLAVAVLLAAGPARANDFPTLARVQYVQQCQNANPGPLFEMQSKCSCALDQLASQLSYEQFDTLKTVTDAMSIGGERGGALRDNPQVRPMMDKLRQLEGQVARACFLKRVR